MSETGEFDGCIGIDLGTTYSCVGVWIDDHVEIIPNDLGNRTTPSWVAFSGRERLVGEAARQQANNNPKNTLYDIKRILGKHYHDPTLQADLEHYMFDIVPDNVDRPLIEVEVARPTTEVARPTGEVASASSEMVRRQFKPEEISAMVLQKMKTIAEDYLGKRVKNAVITVPAYFNDAQRNATKNAAQIAGLNCLRIINEPTAACLCYGLQTKKTCNVLIFDLGGGTFDVSLLELSGGVFEVKATAGDTHLGGEDFDHRLASYLRDQFERKTGRKLAADNAKAHRKLKEAAETAKRRLSQLASVRVEIDALDGVDFNCQLTRSTFEQLCGDLFNKCLEPVERVLKDAELDRKEIDEIVLVGGSTRIPKIQEILSSYFGGKTLNKSVNPDEAVAYGAAVQGAILAKSDNSGKTKDLLLVDVIPLSLGIETTGGVMTTIIPRNSTVPCEKSSMFSTIEDNQSTVLIQVFEGERKFTRDNHKLGTFELTGIPKSMRGVPKIEVSFKLDTNGILTVTAIEKASQISQNVTISKESGRLSQEEIARMVEDADRYRAEDELRKEIIDYRNAFEKYLQNAQQTINDTTYAGSLTTEEQSYANQLILTTFDWLNTTDPSKGDVVERSKDELTNCKQSVEYYLKPLVNKVYARQVAAKTKSQGGDTKSQAGDTKSQAGDTSKDDINQLLLEQFETPVSTKPRIQLKTKK